VSERTWLDERSAQSVRHALERCAPDLCGGSITLQPWIGTGDPHWSVGTAVVEGGFVAKFAWSEPAATRLWHEALVLRALGAHATQLRVPEVVVASEDPVFLVTRRVEGDPLTYELVSAADRSEVEEIGAELASFLSHLHDPAVLAHVVEAVGYPDVPHPQATTEALRGRLGPWVRPDQLGMVQRWCDWVDDALAPSAGAVFVHGDLHGHNQVWDHDRRRLRIVVDFESCGAAEAEYDFRYLPAQGDGVRLLLATAAHYRDRTARPLRIDRVMAWHLRTALGDALWRSEAGVALPDGATPSAWVDELRQRLDALALLPC